MNDILRSYLALERDSTDKTDFAPVWQLNNAYGERQQEARQALIESLRVFVGEVHQ